MKTFRAELGFLIAILLFVGADGAQVLSQDAVADLGGTSWQLVKFQGSDDTTLKPDKSKYTVAFEKDGSVSMRIDCNRGHGTWKFSGPNQIEFGPMALTRAMCPPAPLTDRIPRDWEYVRSYILKDKHLFLASMVDAGIYEFEPMGADDTAGAAVKGTATYRERMALPPSAVFEATLEDVSKADAPAEVISHARKENPGNPPIAFEIPYDREKIDPSHTYAVRARITVGDELMFTTTQNYPVLTHGNQNEVTLLLQRSTGSTVVKRPEFPLLGLPATFVGTLPCADCPGVHYQVNLLADHRFVSRMSYEEREGSFEERGTWQLANEGKVLVLQGSKAREQFALLDRDTLRKLDANGTEIESKLNYDLKRALKFTPIEQKGHAVSDASLENTYWKLTRLGDAPVTSASQKQEANFVLNSDSHRISGSGGCNRLTGSYELHGDRITFSQMAGTMMACLQGMETEQAFLDVLKQATRWKITGQQLELLDDTGRQLASFEANHQK